MHEIKKIHQQYKLRWIKCLNVTSSECGKKYICPCGSSFRKGDNLKHYMTKKHCDYWFSLLIKSDNDKTQELMALSKFK